jgi:cyclic pyranopterin phosphate synthase
MGAGSTDDEAADLLTWCSNRGDALRFIEQMPLDPQYTAGDRDEMISADELLGAARHPLRPDARRRSRQRPRGGVPRRRRPATVGVVGSVSRPFCGPATGCG